MHTLDGSPANILSPEQLFVLYRERTEKVAQSLCWHFQISGALAHQDEAKSEALVMLWRKCRTFDPKQQAFQSKKSQKESEIVFWTILYGGKVTTREVKDPYQTFWIWAITAIRGSVIDYFRKEKLITRKQGQDENQRPTLLHRDRFLSASSSVKAPPGLNFDNTSIFSYFDLLPSRERADDQDEARDRKLRISRLMLLAQLTEPERKVVELLYTNAEPDKAEVALQMNKSKAWVIATLKTAIEKMRMAGTPVIVAKTVDTNYVALP